VTRATPRLSEIERDIVRFVASHQPCRYEDVRIHIGYRSKSTAFDHVRRLRAYAILRGAKNVFGFTKSRTLQLGNDIAVSRRGDIYWFVRMDGFREVQDGDTGSTGT